MQNQKILVFLIFIFAFVIIKSTFATQPEVVKQFDTKVYTVDIYGGAQLSGIRKEDFVKENVTPYINVLAAIRVAPWLSVAAGYHGPYFNFIGDNFRHKYFYIDSDAIVNVNQLFGFAVGKRWRLNVIAGTGILNNSFEKKLNWCLTGALVPEIILNDKYSLKLKAGGIAGWAIYQHDKDMLLNLSAGISRKF